MQTINEGYNFSSFLRRTDYALQPGNNSGTDRAKTHDKIAIIRKEKLLFHLFTQNIVEKQRAIGGACEGDDVR